MKKFLVTGANGFVGRALCGTLGARGLPFVAAVRQATQAGQYPTGDLGPATKWEPALRDCDVVIHLAARVHIMNDVARDPLAAFREMNVDATLNLARQAAACGVKRFVFVSSVKVNGEETTGRPFTAFDAPAPNDAYGQSKHEAELALAALARETGLEVVIVRPPLIYGPGVRANFFKLMQLVKLGVPLPLGAVRNRRSMVALDNLLDLLITCALHSGAAGQTFLVSDDDDVSVSELLRMLARSMGKPSRLLPFPASALAGIAAVLGKSAVANRLLGSLQVDIAHTKSTLGWQPPAGVQASLDKAVAHFLRQH